MTRAEVGIEWPRFENIALFRVIEIVTMIVTMLMLGNTNLAIMPI